MANKHLIEIMWIQDYVKNHEQYCNNVLGLRKARRAGDREVINNTVLGVLRRHNVEFKVIDWI